MDQLLRIAKSLGIPRWRILRIKVTNEKKHAEAELKRATDDPEDWDSIPELVAWRVTLDNVLIWMEQIEEVQDE